MSTKIGHIIIGWAKRFGLIHISSAEKKMSELRIQICARCTRAKTSNLIRVINGKIENDHSLICTICHCPCLEKSLVIDETCPINKW